MENVDILTPPNFVKSGIVKTREEAWKNQDWIGTFNLWILTKNPVPAVIYQIRSEASSWAPGKLDVTAGGHYSAGEEIQDGLREVEEELGVKYDFTKLIGWGRKMHVSPDELGQGRHNIVDIFLIEDERPINEYQLQKDEVFDLCVCPVDELVKVHTIDGYAFEAESVDHDGQKFMKQVTRDSFPYNWDNYHYKIALLSSRYFAGEKNLIY